MRIAEITPQPNWILTIVAEDGRVGEFDVSQYINYDACTALKDKS